MKKHPVVAKRPHELSLHGHTRTDEYYWLKERENPEVLKYLHDQMDHLEETMAHTKPLQEQLFSEMKERMQETDSTVPVKRGAYLYYQRTEAGKQYPVFCRRNEKDGSQEEILLDQNVLAEGKTFCSVSAYSISPDGNKLAYSVDVDGDEVYTIYFKDLTNNTLYPESILNTYGSVYVLTGVEWANDSETIFYATLDDAKRPCKLFHHKLGSDPAQDKLIHHEEDETYFLFFAKTRDDQYIITCHLSTMTTEARYFSASDPDDEIKIIFPRRQNVEYYADHHNGYFIIKTNENAKNYRIVRTPVTNLEPENWEEILPHRTEAMLTGFELFEKHLVVYERSGGVPKMRISSVDGTSAAKYINFPDPTYYFDVEENPDYSTNILRIKYSSLVTPHTIVDCHMDSGEWEVKKEEQVAGFDKSQYACEFIHATASDGKQIPMSIAYRKDIKRDGNNPTLLHGYGAYGSNLEVEFTPNRLSLLDRGFVFAMAHIRGSSTLGREWYEDGKILKKKNSFTDFITCAEHLIKEGFTSKDKLSIYGVSAGGLLVTASMIMRPDLYKAVIAKVPFVDVITSMSDPSIPLTTHEYDEWGNPNIKEQYDYMLSYSPYDNIKPTEYPNLLLTAGYNDPRVMYWEPAKFAAKIREHKTDNNILLLRTNFHAGHAGSSGRYDYLKEVAFEYAFLIDRLQA